METKIFHLFLRILLIPFIIIAKLASFVMWGIICPPQETIKSCPCIDKYAARLQQITDAANHYQSGLIKAGYELEQERLRNRSLTSEIERLKKQVRDLQLKRN